MYVLYIKRCKIIGAGLSKDIFFLLKKIQIKNEYGKLYCNFNGSIQPLERYFPLPEFVY